MRILFITATRIGDAVLASGVLAHLIAHHPGAEITIACGPVVAPLYAALPGLKQVLVMRKQRRAGGHWLTLWRAAVPIRWDLVVDLRSSGLSWLLRSRSRRILSPVKTQEHRVLRYSKVLGGDHPLPPRVWLSAAAEAGAQARLPEPGRALALGPTANWHGKQWPIERFVALLERLTAPGAPFAQAPILVLSGPGERDAALPLLNAIPAGRLVDLAGTVDLLTAAACLARARLYIGNDSGLMHLAAATGTLTLGLFGPSPDKLYAPFGPNAACVRGEPFEGIVHAPDFDRFAPRSYMTALTIEAVHQAALALLNRSA